MQVTTLNAGPSTIRNLIPLIPDADLLLMIDEMLATPPPTSNRLNDRERQTQFARRMEAISREIKARGMNNPTWWSARRQWEVEDLQSRRRNRFIANVSAIAEDCSATPRRSPSGGTRR